MLTWPKGSCVVLHFGRLLVAARVYEEYVRIINQAVVD